MGLTIDCFEFDAMPPTRDELVEYLFKQIHGQRGLDTYEIDGRRATLLCMLDAVTRAYAVSFLKQRGGRSVDFVTGKPVLGEIPAFVDRPWQEHSIWFRFNLKIRFLFALWRMKRS